MSTNGRSTETATDSIEDWQQAASVEASARREAFALADRVRAAFLRYLQIENGCVRDGTCERVGVPCRDQQKCGCWLEMEGYITNEQ